MTDAAVIAAVDAGWGEPCETCRAGLIGHDVVLSLLLGHRDAPRCIACLASAHAMPNDVFGAFVRRAQQNVRRLACYRAGWVHSDRRLAAAGAWPEERVPEELRLDGDEEDAAAEQPSPSSDTVAGDLAALVCAAEYDAGDKGCGELALELRKRVEQLGPGDVLRLSTTDAGAPEDLPAWCRMTGHRLRGAAHPLYWIERKPL